MEKKQWVQHISGQGEKWRLMQRELQEEEIWVAHRGTVNANVMLFLPKSEYRLCEPPERWKDVTEDVKLGCEPSCLLYDNLGRNLAISNGYRIRKIEVNMIGPGIPYGCKKQWAFIVEQKVS